MYFKLVAIIFLAVNAIFWSLFPHETHCKVVGMMTTAECPPHKVHLIIGVISFVLALVLAQYDYLKTLI